MIEMEERRREGGPFLARVSKLKHVSTFSTVVDDDDFLWDFLYDGEYWSRLTAAND